MGLMEQKQNKCQNPNPDQTTDLDFSASESLENQGLQEPEITEGTKGRVLDFQQVNEVT